MLLLLCLNYKERKIYIYMYRKHCAWRESSIVKYDVKMLIQCKGLGKQGTRMCTYANEKIALGK